MSRSAGPGRSPTIDQPGAVSVRTSTAHSSPDASAKAVLEPSALEDPSLCVAPPSCTTGVGRADCERRESLGKRDDSRVQAPSASAPKAASQKGRGVMPEDLNAGSVPLG